MTDAEDKSIEDAELAVLKAEEDLRRAKADWHIARLDDARARAHGWIKANEGISIKDLGEAVADAARDHGAECARDADVSTTRSWKRFRILLAELVRRGGG